MSQQAEICQFCGGEIVFRMIRGVVTPIHQGKANCIGRSLYRNDQEGIPHHTKCPKCGGDVIFLRSNGGSVWLQSIGWPWPKHPCFDYDTEVKSKNPILFCQTDFPKDYELLYARFIGRLTSGKGVVVLLAPTKDEVRLRPTRHKPRSQWDIFCSPGEVLFLEGKIRSNLVLVNSGRTKLALI